MTEAYMMGRDAKARGDDESQNPFREYTSDHKDWLDGFNGVTADSDDDNPLRLLGIEGPSGGELDGDYGLGGHFTGPRKR